jgi:hypothetical protein
MTHYPAFAWVGEGLPKPVTKSGLDHVTLPMGKTAGTIVLTEELVNLSAPFGELVMQPGPISVLLCSFTVSWCVRR